MLILIVNQRHPLPLILNKPHPQFFLIKNILNLRKKFSDIYCAKDWHEISRYSQMTAECQPLNFGKIGLGTLICQSKFIFESLFLVHAHCKTENMRMYC